ncbi:MAG TPA: hypothetical protein VH079_02475 [Terriglobales bacterium]|nr:hypothetical protein [Terriglobales bacterium]
MRVRCEAMIALLALVTVAGAFAQQPAGTPVDLVRRTVQNEMKANDSSTPFSFQERRESPSGSQTELIVETREAMAGMLIANNDHPLSPQERQAEIGRLDHLVQDPAELAKKKAKEAETKDRITRIVKALPDAFLYDFDGTDTGNSLLGGQDARLIRLKFRPNPKYNPPTHVEQVLTGMQGIMLIDAKQERIARIDGTLTSEVGFGWGILGHLNQGGHFMVDQADMGTNNWEVTRMGLDLTGKVLFFKSLAFKSTKTYSDFHPAPPNLSFAEGVDMLKKKQGIMAATQQADAR